MDSDDYQPSMHAPWRTVPLRQVMVYQLLATGEIELNGAEDRQGREGYLEEIRPPQRIDLNKVKIRRDDLKFLAGRALAPSESQADVEQPLVLSSLEEACAYLAGRTGRAWTPSGLLDFALNNPIDEAYSKLRGISNMKTAISAVPPSEPEAVFYVHHVKSMMTRTPPSVSVKPPSEPPEETGTDESTKDRQDRWLREIRALGFTLINGKWKAPSGGITLRAYAATQKPAASHQNVSAGIKSALDREDAKKAENGFPWGTKR